MFKRMCVMERDNDEGTVAGDDVIQEVEVARRRRESELRQRSVATQASEVLLGPALSPAASAFVKKLDIAALADVGPAFYHLLEELLACDDPKAADALAATLLDGLWEQLNIGPWRDVRLVLRRTFSYASLVRARAVLLLGEQSRAVEVLDRGLVLGAPLGDGESPNWLAQAAGRAHGRWQIPQDLERFVEHLEGTEDLSIVSSIAAGTPYVDQTVLPSVSEFLRTLTAKRPVKILQLTDGWPAMSRWNLRYFLQVMGQRTVPIEVGSRYTDEEWSQKLVTIETFVRDFLQPAAKEEIGYLAQYNLLDQVPELRADIIVPDYCYVLSDSEPDVNFWFGGRTTSPLHFDDRDNILTQVFGSKLILLYDAEETDLLYPFETAMLHNTSRVDPEQLHDPRYPRFASAKGTKVLLEPGQALFIPKGCWHFVKSVSSVSCSVSFWFS
ncbi:lysine-specific demethylase 8-like [Tropilaelaps mercedesae]|uniref:JmjC domain-containing protein 5 n=1 Tax=Tropilaelaps mercedesae TaxID=418985 RepID=A0A1V9WYQ0_9ACAR|nr:lysine-specific demethylase 8-like [Tropilaelaps mercedesae]